MIESETNRQPKRTRDGDAVPTNLIESTHKLCRVQAAVFGHHVELILDSGAALEGVLAEHLVPSAEMFRKEDARLLKLSDGRTVWTLGSITTDVSFEGATMAINFVVLPTSAFSGILGLHFFPRKEVTSFSLKPPRLCVKSQDVPLLLSEEAPLQSLSWYPESDMGYPFPIPSWDVNASVEDDFANKVPLVYLDTRTVAWVRGKCLGW